MRQAIFNPLVRKDLNQVLAYYEEEGGDLLADRFFDQFMTAVEKSVANPRRFHPVSELLRRADIEDFPYHFLYREKDWGIRVLVLRHDRRHPSFGLRRR
jgi:plasmid stabilization system protein ParE